MPLRFPFLLLLVSLLLGAGAPTVVADGASATGEAERPDRPGDRVRPIPPEFEGIGVEERLGETVPADIPFVDSEGRDVLLGDYFRGDVPVVVTFVYHDCPMLCSLVLNGVTDVMREARMTLGRDYRVLAVSFDPTDTPERAAAAKEVYSRRLGFESEDYAFLTGTPEAIARLTDAVGFRYRWLEAQQEYGHTATLVFLSPEGVITRYLYGLQYAPADFSMAVREARAGTVGTTLDQIFLYCFMFDPETGGYVLQAMNVMKLGGLLTMLLLGGTLFVFWRRERRRNARARRAGRPGWADFEGDVSPAPHP